MKAAIYARYSSDKQSEASLQDQARNCERLIQREGWELARNYEDKAVSGSKRDRAGYQCMLKDAQGKQFNVLVVDDLSRLSRDEVELKQALKRLTFWGIRVIGVSDGFDTNDKSHKVQSSVRGLINEIYLDDLREKTHRGLTGRALEGKNAGGCPYGYKVIYETVTDDRGRVVSRPVDRALDDKQAEVVRQIFQWFADGDSPRRIASRLNEAGIPSPRGGKWNQSAIYGDMRKGTGILNNTLYIGQHIWNRSEWVKDPDTGKRLRRERPQEDWITTALPHLRIVPQPLWDACKARQEKTRASTETQRSQHGKVSTGRGPKYLFSSLLKCGKCGKNYVITSKYSYGCASHINGGEHACDNTLRVPRALVEDKLLAGIKRDLFTPEGIKLFQAETRRLLAEARKARQPDTTALQAELAELDVQISRMVEAIANGTDSPALHARLKEAEAHKAELETRLDVGSTALDTVADVLPGAVDRFRELVADMGNTTQTEVNRIRTQIKKLVGEITLHPSENGEYLEAEMEGDYGGLLKLAGSGNNPASQILMVAGAGFEPTTFGL